MVVLFDACVLYPAPLRDFLMHLASTDLFAARWTNAIHEEWMRNLLEVRPDLIRSQLERTRNLMNQHVMDCLVDGYEHLIEQIQLPDPDDRHVLAAAIHCEAEVILTFNLKDFPETTLNPWGIIAQNPDDFICEWIEHSPSFILQAIQTQQSSLKRPPMSMEQLLIVLERQQIPKSVAKLRAI